MQQKQALKALLIISVEKLWISVLQIENDLILCRFSLLVYYLTRNSGNKKTCQREIDYYSGKSLGSRHLEKDFHQCTILNGYSFKKSHLEYLEN